MRVVALAKAYELLKKVGLVDGEVCLQKLSNFALLIIVLGRFSPHKHLLLGYSVYHQMKPPKNL